MKLNTSSSLKLISLFPLSLLFVLSLYFAYQTYGQYQNNIKMENNLKANKVLKNLLLNLAKERSFNAVYMGSKGKIGKSSLFVQREQTNQAIREFDNYYKNRSVDITTKRIFRYLPKIFSLRAAIDEQEISFNKMFFNYYSKINLLIYKEYKKILNIQQTPQIFSENSLKINLLQKIEKSSQEKGYISYILTKRKPLTNDEFSRWIKIFSLPDLTTLNIQAISQNLNNRLFVLFHNERAKKIYRALIKSKIKIINENNTGVYDVNPSKWFNLMNLKIGLLNQAEKAISLEIHSDIENLLENKIKPQLVIVAGILILVIFLLVIGFFIDRYIRNGISELEKLFSKVGQLADIDEKIDFQTMEDVEKGYKIIEIAIDQIQQDKQTAIEATKAKSIFLANMSHEIRTPLNGIIGFTELLKNSDLSDEEKDFVDIIEKSSDNLLDIINNILDLSKIESDKIEIEEILFSPIDEFEHAVEVFGAKAAEKNIKLSFYMDPSLNNYLSGDPTKIKEVVVNLLSNAIKFTPVDGEIDVEIKRISEVDEFGKTKVKFSVQDNGIGVSKDKIKTIFNAFSQADSTITRKYGGTGLGLTISSKYIAMMGGKLDLTSVEGEGTKFFFTLEFSESPSSEENTKDKFSEYRCAILSSEMNRKSHAQYTYDYLKYFGCSAEFFYAEQEIKKLLYRKNINFLILDAAFIKEEEIEKYKKLQIPGIIILKSSMKNDVDKYTSNLIKPLYEPINVTKLNNILEKQKEFLPKVEELKKEFEKDNETQSEEQTGEAVSKESAEEEKGIKILVAEDNEINRKLIKKTLEKFGANIVLANNGQEAVEEVQNRKFDLIFMDIAMPVMDGVRALKTILNYEFDKKLKHTPIVALTANALQGDRERFLKEGFDEYVTKPIKLDNIDFILKTFLEEKYYEKNSYEKNSNEKLIESKKDNISTKTENLKKDVDIVNKHEEEKKEEQKEVLINETKKPVEKQKEVLKEKVFAQRIKKEKPKIKNTNIHILVAEDNLINQKLIEKTLNNLGFEVTIVNNGQEALDAYKNNQYDIIFMDIAMPIMNGVDATHSIIGYENQNNLPHTPIIALTANAVAGDRETFLEEGLDEYISKPLRKADIERVLKMFLDYDINQTKKPKEEQLEYDNFYDITSNEEEDKYESSFDYNEVEENKNDIATKDVLIFKNNKIETKILNNIILEKGYTSDFVTNYDEFVSSMETYQYKIIMFDETIEFVDTEDIIEEVDKMEKERGQRSILVEFADNEEKGLSEADEVMGKVINKQKIDEILEKYIR